MRGPMGGWASACWWGWEALSRLGRGEDWARDRDPTEATEEVGLWWWADLWEWTEPSLLDLHTINHSVIRFNIQ